jgi:hypothetical protein
MCPFLVFSVERAIGIAVFTMEFLLASGGAAVLAQIDRAAFPTGDSNHGCSFAPIQHRHDSTDQLRLGHYRVLMRCADERIEAYYRRIPVDKGASLVDDLLKRSCYSARKRPG